MKILSIETSCDETALSVLEVKGSKTKPVFTVLANITASQAKLHATYGGVFPMMAKREHVITLPIILEKILKKLPKQKNVQSRTLNKKELEIEVLLMRETGLFAELKKVLEKYPRPNIDMIAVTEGPGLEPALWVGINFAKALSVAWDVPLVPVNHMEGHILSIFVKGTKKSFAIPKVKFPIISLLVSGGHTEIVVVKDWGNYTKIGETRDDAAGEAFDKVARILGLPYPGGPEISRLAEVSRKLKADNYKLKAPLPRPMLKTPDFDFSFSGLKTAVLYLVRDLGTLTENMKATIAREFEDAAAEVLVTKTLRAAKQYKAKTIIIGGGVSANKHLQKELTSTARKEKIQCLFPTKALTTDNALMIAIAGYFASQRKKRSVKSILAKGNLTF